MIRFLQTPGPIKKIVLGGLLTVICAAMAITLIPGGLGSDVIGIGTPGQGVVANVAGEPVTTARSAARGPADAAPAVSPRRRAGGHAASLISPSAPPRT